MTPTRDEAAEIVDLIRRELLKVRELMKQHPESLAIRRRALVLTDALGKACDDLERLRPVPPKAMP